MPRELEAGDLRGFNLEEARALVKKLRAEEKTKESSEKSVSGERSQQESNVDSVRRSATRDYSLAKERALRKKMDATTRKNVEIVKTKGG